MVVSYLALIIAVLLVSFDNGLAITLRKAGTGILAPNRDSSENLFVVLDECFGKFGHGFLMKNMPHSCNLFLLYSTLSSSQ